jgi:hypothetical protein
MATSRTPEKLIKLLRKQKEELAGDIRFLREAHAVIAMFLERMFYNSDTTFACQ